jgi:hypothetical protein
MATLVVMEPKTNAPKLAGMIDTDYNVKVVPQTIRNPSVVAYERGTHWNTIFDNIGYNLILILLTYIYTLCYHNWKFFYK